MPMLAAIDIRDDNAALNGNHLGELTIQTEQLKANTALKLSVRFFLNTVLLTLFT